MHLARSLFADVMRGLHEELMSPQEEQVMTDDERQIEEYKTLREEILQNQRALVQFLTIFISMSTAVFGYALSNESSYGMLAPLILLIPGVYLVVGQWEQMYRIGAYIRLVIEPELPGLSWESSWAELRSFGLKSTRNPFWRFNKTAAVLVVFHGFEILCVCAAYFAGKAGKVLPAVCLAVVLVHTCHSIMFARTASDSNYHEAFWRAYLEKKGTSSA